MVTNNAVNISAAGIVKYDGAGTFSADTVTQYSPLVGGASNAITSIGPLTNGQLIIGSTGTNPSAATLTAGTGVTITNAAGTVTINASGGGVTWTDVTGTSQAMAVSNGYIADNASLVTLTLPTTAAIGDTVIIVGKGAGGWKVTYTTGQQIQVGSTASTLTTGNIASTNQWDGITLVCVTANNIWAARAVQGNITVA
jgi:hypothetical protein